MFRLRQMLNWLGLAVLLLGACGPAAPPAPAPLTVATAQSVPTATALPSATPTPALSDLKLTVLFDNTTTDPRLKPVWGFAALVEYGPHTLLFDTGAQGATLLENMRELHVDPASIETIVISHEHADHTGGLQALLDTGIRPVVYLPSKFTNALKDRVRAQTTLVEVTDSATIAPGMHLSIPQGSIVEQSLAVETPHGTAVIVGCAHPGIAEMVRRAKELLPAPVTVLVGGFHIQEVSTMKKLPESIAQLREMGLQRVMPTHCTGIGAIKKFRTEFGDGFVEGGVGSTIGTG